ncbi:MAG: S6e family ribosomal protein [Nanoarchaeota archaeon]
MVFKINISDKGKAWKIEGDVQALMGKNVGDKISGKEIKTELEGYELEITGGSDSAGFPLSKNIEGVYLRKALLTKGFGMKENIEGLRKRKTLRGKQISETTVQINMIVLKHGSKHLHEIFPEQNQPKAKKVEVAVKAA